MTISDHGTVTSYSMLLQTFLFLLILFLPLFFSSFSFLPYPYSLLSRRERNARWNVAQTYLHVSHAVSIFFYYLYCVICRRRNDGCKIVWRNTAFEAIQFKEQVSATFANELTWRKKKNCVTPSMTSEKKIETQKERNKCTITSVQLARLALLSVRNIWEYKTVVVVDSFLISVYALFTYCSSCNTLLTNEDLWPE